jgi:hypothetical protein
VEKPDRMRREIALLVRVDAYGFLRVSFSMTSDLAEESVRRVVGVTLAGAIMLFVLQWVFSWSNVLSLVPIIGQFMTGLSRAPSQPRVHGHSMPSRLYRWAPLRGHDPVPLRPARSGPLFPNCLEKMINSDRVVQ